MSTTLSHVALLAQTQLEALYALEHEGPVTDFVVSLDAARHLPGTGSRTLVCEDGDGVALAVVFANGVSEMLDRSDPRVALGSDNIDAFCTVIEEVSHFLLLTFCARWERSVTRFELELQGEVDKYLATRLAFPSQGRSSLARRLRSMLFRDYRLSEDLTGEQSERYNAASALADRYCGHLERSYIGEGRLADLERDQRRFYRLGQREKLERITSVD